MGSLFSYSLLEKQGNRFLFYEILKFFSSLCLVRKVRDKIFDLFICVFVIETRFSHLGLFYVMFVTLHLS